MKTRMLTRAVVLAAVVALASLALADDAAGTDGLDLEDLLQAAPGESVCVHYPVALDPALNASAAPVVRYAVL